MIKHFIDLIDYNKRELRYIINFAHKIKKNPSKYNELLKNKSMGMIFEKKSIRTRVSFHIGILRLGGKAIELDKNEIGFGHRESDKDIINILSQYLDCLLVRNHNHSKIIEISRLNALPIINGLSNISHPCQILSDIFTIEETFGSINKLKIAWIGDINNVLYSLIQAAHIFKFTLSIASPQNIMKNKKKFINDNSNNKINFTNDPNKAVQKADCVMTDTWRSMGESKLSNKKKLFKNFQVNDSLMQKTKKKSIFMHCLPAHRNEEVSNSVIDGKRSVVLRQAQNRMYIQQSILNFLLNK